MSQTTFSQRSETAVLVPVLLSDVDEQGTSLEVLPDEIVSMILRHQDDATQSAEAVQRTQDAAAIIDDQDITASPDSVPEVDESALNRLFSLWTEQPSVLGDIDGPSTMLPSVESQAAESDEEDDTRSRSGEGLFAAVSAFLAGSFFFRHDRPEDEDRL